MRMNEIDPQPPERGKTRPWMAGEYIHVDGQRLVYTVNKSTGAVIVRLPGGRAESVDGLRAKGRRVTMPRTLRTNDFA